MFVQYGTRTNTMLHCYLSCFALNTPLLVSRKDVCCILTQRIRQRVGPLGELQGEHFVPSILFGSGSSAQLGLFFRTSGDNETFIHVPSSYYEQQKVFFLARDRRISFTDSEHRFLELQIQIIDGQCSMHETDGLISQGGRENLTISNNVF
jgi:hypothetical protein